MTLEEFAKKCGVVIMECDHLWGGTFGWSTKENPNCAELGFKTEKAAYKNWMQQTFGDAAAKEVMKLLKEKNNGEKYMNMTFTIEQLAELVREFPSVYAHECALRLLEQQAYIASLEKQLTEIQNNS